MGRKVNDLVISILENTEEKDIVHAEVYPTVAKTRAQAENAEKRK